MRSKSAVLIGTGFAAVFLVACGGDGGGGDSTTTEDVSIPEDPGPADPDSNDSATNDPGMTDPGPTDPGVNDPGPSDPGKTDPGPTDPGPGDPGKNPVGYAQVQTIFSARCASCHTTTGSGGTNFGSDYGDTQKNANSCSGKKMFECIEIRILNGTMPKSKGCTGNPVTDDGNVWCLTQPELDLVHEWVAGGGSP